MREGCTERAMDWAARDGHIEVVNWLHENREVVNWLHGLANP